MGGISFTGFLMRYYFSFLALLVIFVFGGCSTSDMQPRDTQTLSGTSVSAYLSRDYLSVVEVKERLRKAGFDVLATYSPINDGEVVLFTNDALKQAAASQGRGYVAVQRVFVDKHYKHISFTNPLYFGKAFMQERYDQKVFGTVLAQIEMQFGSLERSADSYGFDDLGSYQFMIGMPRYEDQMILAHAHTTEILLEKAQHYKGGKKLLFALKLANGSVVLGYDLSAKTERFVSEIGRANAALLPWIVVLENGKAQTLNPKYYIALCYPLLDMSGFMGIATVPGDIKRELERMFR